MILLFSIYEELTDMICVSEVGSRTFADLNVLGIDGRAEVGIFSREYFHITKHCLPQLLPIR
jgi:hypothetical protein